MSELASTHRCTHLQQLPAGRGRVISHGRGGVVEAAAQRPVHGAAGLHGRGERQESYRLSGGVVVRCGLGRDMT